MPTKEGYYWYCDFGEHTPCILKVTKEGRYFWAQNQEFSFVIKKDGSLWAFIPNPIINGETVEPDSY